MEQIILEPEPKTFGGRNQSWSKKFWMLGAGTRNLSFVHFFSNYCDPWPLLFSYKFFKAGCNRLQIGQLKSYGVSTSLRPCQDDCGIYYAYAVRGWNLLSNIFRGKLQ